MLVLTVETSTPRSSVALVDQDGTVAQAALGVPRRHGEFIAPAIAFCLEQSGRTAADVSGVAVGLGPGLYTGLRVGIATAQAFAAARQLPVVGMCGLDVLAFQTRHVRRLVCATLDARRGEVFWAFYRNVPGGVQRLGELRVGRPDELTAELESAGEDCLVVGDGGVRYAQDLEGVHTADVAGATGLYPDAAALGALAVPRFIREETERPGALQPIYLRTADAKIGWQQRGRLQGGEG
jgi:tRNA threonylcarbamoyladenosine biosynthesis protein TsaB